MATVAAMLKARGWDVRGSDHSVYPPMSTFLREQGIAPLDGYTADHITGDLGLVCVGNAISRGNPELEAVLDRKIRYCSLPELVREQFLWAARSIVVAGTHGKTTTTSLVGWLLTSAGRDPSMLVGGIAANFGGGYRLGGGREFVIEGDEYDSAFFDKTAKFLKYLPDIAIVNNIEFDHADIYPDLAAVELAFKRLAVLVPRNGLLLLGADSPRAAALAAHAASPVETFGVDGDPTWKATDLAVGPGGTRFKVHKHGTLVGTFEVPLLGAHNVRNALAGDRRLRHPGHRQSRHRGGAEDVRRRQASPGAARLGRRHRGLRRLRPPSDGRRRDHGGAAAGAPDAAPLGHLRAAVGVVVPEDLPERLRRGLRGRRPGARRAGVPQHARRGSPALAGGAGRRPRGEGPSRPRRDVDRRHRRHRRRARPSRAISSSSCRTAASTASTTSCSTRSARPRPK